MDYSNLIKDNTRDDQFINATKLVAAFPGKRLDHWLKSTETLEFKTALEKRLSENPQNKAILETRRGKGGGTFVHPLLAIHLAEYLSPEFSLFVKETFKSFLEADVNLTTNLISRTEKLADIEAIVEKSKTQRKYLQSEFALNYESGILEEQHNARWLTGRIKGYNNDCAGVEDGMRSTMSDTDKSTMSFTQLAQAKKFERMRKSENPYLKASDAKIDAYEIAEKAHFLMYGELPPKPRDFAYMPESEKKRLDCCNS